MDSHGATPTSKTLQKLKDALKMLHTTAGDSFMTQLFEIKGQWTVKETANGYTFTRADEISPETTTGKNVQ